MLLLLEGLFSESQMVVVCTFSAVCDASAALAIFAVFAVSAVSWLPLCLARLSFAFTSAPLQRRLRHVFGFAKLSWRSFEFGGGEAWNCIVRS